MTDAGERSPLAAAGTDAEGATDAFAALSDETRLAILLALWEATDPLPPVEGIPFSELRERVGSPDSGQFNYHLGKLEGQYVRQVEGGYALRRAGRRVVRTVVAGQGIAEPSLDRTEIPVDCPHCGAGTAVTYVDERLYWVCTGCEGSYGGGGDRPQGYLSATVLDPAGFADRSPAEVWAAGTARAHTGIGTMLEGVCGECSGRVERHLDVCADHPEEGVCEDCGRRPRSLAYLGCTVCDHYHVASPATVVIHHPAAVAFYYERGVAVQYDTDSVEAVRRRVALAADRTEELVGTDPPRVRVTLRHAGDAVRLTVDGDLRVVDVVGPG